jgi:hypothetical protein
MCDILVHVVADAISTSFFERFDFVEIDDLRIGVVAFSVEHVFYVAGNKSPFDYHKKGQDHRLHKFQSDALDKAIRIRIVWKRNNLGALHHIE